MTTIDWSNYLNFSSLITFVVGIVFGLLAAGVFYLLLVLRSIRLSERVVKPEKVSASEAMFLINAAKEKYANEKKRRTIKERFELTKNIGQDLAFDIAKFHFPESKNPYLEISIYELLETTKYIVERFENILSRKPLNRLKNLSGIQVLELFELKKRYEENKYVKKAQELSDSKVGKSIKAVYSAISPAYFIRKTVINTTMMLSVDAMNRVFLNIVGEEVYKLYSKELFRMDDTETLLEVKEDE